ncbi:hypothetical protein ELG79_36565 [Rhizobium leguminosarum]|uniref:hypothetical protein n=1 Tax=Rhizobium leguminosarum TaxID=384 RepID=UPI0010308171|nr:hypothetical protein [Rhizobium leguminosarum]TBG08437.1 hypothetical protein ELG79_36565 [Rhizobium leguminosarum]
MSKKLLVVMKAGLFATTILIAANGSAHACGVVGCIFNSVVPGAGDVLDDVNRQAGKPFDHAVAAAAEAYVPGAGQAMEEYWALQDAGVFNQQGGQPAPAPRQVPAPAPNYQQQYQQQYQQHPQVSQNPQVPSSGNFCSVPGVGRFGPYPVSGQLGMQCWVSTQNGPIYGFVSM